LKNPADIAPVVSEWNGIVFIPNENEPSGELMDAIGEFTIDDLQQLSEESSNLVYYRGEYFLLEYECCKNYEIEMSSAFVI
jgi:hypothetical protein